MTIDRILPAVAGLVAGSPDTVSTEHRRIIRGMAKQLEYDIFFTEAQARLLTRILTENAQTISATIPALGTVLKEGAWSQPFRVLAQSGKIYKDPCNEGRFVIEAQQTAEVKTALLEVLSAAQGLIHRYGAGHSLRLTEHNLYLAVSAFEEFRFDVDSELLNLYSQIREIKLNTPNPFEIYSTENSRLRSAVEKEIGPIDPSNWLLIQDRRHRYQYHVANLISDGSIESKIANRPGTRVHADSKLLPFETLLESLEKLQRFPVLFVFDGRTPAKDLADLKKLEHAASLLGGQVGIYFRHTTADCAEFNQLIAQLGFNKQLDTQTSAAGLSNGKLPKFMIKQQWKPCTVISFTTLFKSNKSAAYFEDVDLTIYYTPAPLLGEEPYAIM